MFIPLKTKHVQHCGLSLHSFPLSCNWSDYIPIWNKNDLQAFIKAYRRREGRNKRRPNMHPFCCSSSSTLSWLRLVYYTCFLSLPLLVASCNQDWYSSTTQLIKQISIIGTAHGHALTVKLAWLASKWQTTPTGFFGGNGRKPRAASARDPSKCSINLSGPLTSVKVGDALSRTWKKSQGTCERPRRKRRRPPAFLCELATRHGHATLLPFKTPAHNVRNNTM